MAMAGVRQADIARANGIKLSEVCAVVQNRRRTPRTRAAIAEAIGKPVAEIWPDAKPEEEAA